MVAPLAAAFVGLKAGMMIQSAVQAFQSAQVALSLLKLGVEGASVAQGFLNGQISIGEAVVALLTGQMTLAEFASGALAKAQAVIKCCDECESNRNCYYADCRSGSCFYCLME